MMNHDMEVSHSPDENVKNVMNSLNAMVSQIIQAMNEGRSFIFGGIVDAPNPMKFAMTFGQNEDILKVDKLFQQNNQEISSKIIEVFSPKKKGVSANIDKQEDGSVLIKFN